MKSHSSPCWRADYSSTVIVATQPQRESGSDEGAAMLILFYATWSDKITLVRSDGFAHVFGHDVWSVLTRKRPGADVNKGVI